MAKEPLIQNISEAQVVAGRDYIAALADLGFRPDYACWADIPQYIDEQLISRLQLCLISSIVDRIGPRKIYDLLYRAYDAAATPKEVDPFDVALLSPECRPGYEIAKRLQIEHVRQNGGAFSEADDWFMMIERRGIYITGPERRNNSDAQLRAFNRFKGKVMALAA